ncbi:MAG: GNAT family N-acetyltransferase, partial [Arenibacter sp.]|nr:GNAT family N-acetyltransferase [Arenibacter sp.]
MKYSIRDAQADDMAQVHQLIKELAVFEKEEDAVEVTVEDLKRDGFGSEKLFHCYVAESEGDIVGMA